MERTGKTLLTMALALAAACGHDTVDETMIGMNTPTAMNEGSASMSDVSAAAWNRLATRQIFFGHQSVGRNILAGMRRVLTDNPQIRLGLVNADDPAAITGPAFIESNIGRNGSPDTKDDAFAALLDRSLGEGYDAVAMYKYCYVDVQAGTDPEELFASYAARVGELHARYPDLAIVHFTLPLRTAQAGIRETLKTLIGRPTQIRLNMKRNRYNELMLERFAGTDPVFDLARIESTRTDGSRAFSSYLGRRVYMLAPELTDDGGHLDEAAQYRVAEELLVFLASLDTSDADVTEVDDIVSLER